MKKHLVFSVLAAMGLSAGAQSLQSEGYVKWPDSQKLPSYVTAWKAGTLGMEDENFFISRVKPKARFTNVNTQVNEKITPDNDRRVCMWLPVTHADGYNYNALPNSAWDSEAFSLWSYVDHWGDWTAPHGWVPGSFADVAHKNGVGVSGVASIPNATLSGNWEAAIREQAALNSADVAKFLWYHGVDGLGYNSEFYGGGAYVQAIAAQHGDIIKFLESKGNPVAENVWYDGTNANGGCTFDQGLASHNGLIFGSDGERRASMFFNYNWNNATCMSSSANYAENTCKVSPLYIYCGMNMQGGEPRGGETYPLLQNYRLSLGYWGAHSYNMFWLNRTAYGSGAAACQQTYLTDTEKFFTNGAQNPAVDFEVITRRNHYPNSKFFGMSAFATAKSVLCWDLKNEPFITYFNIGNGHYFNWKGETVSGNEWYSIGFQDYMPTWRYWWAPGLMGRHIEADAVKMKAAITWDDAWMGGSCLKISGSDAEAYLHLFKTEFQLNRNDVITVRYKLNAGSADKVTLVLTAKGAETTPLREENLVVLNSEVAADNEEWREVTFKVTGAIASSLTKDPIALMALHFTGAKNLDLLIGEVSIRPASEFAAPAAPQITLAKTISYHKDGVDGKLIWNMANNKAAGEPCYNSDVNTSFFRLWAREVGGEAYPMGVTTSWAGLIFKAPVSVEGNAKVQFGVSAVSLDHNSESAIAWSDPMARPAYTLVDDIQLDKTTIKPGEEFTVSYVDPLHSASTWTIYDTDNVKVAQSASAATSYTGKIDKIGAYDLVIDEGSEASRTYSSYIQISPETVGATPQIYTVSVNGQVATDLDPAISLTMVDGAPTAPVAVSYTGREADGSASRGLSIMQHFVGTPVSDLGLQAGQSFTVAFWAKYGEFVAGSGNNGWALLDITNRGGSWPKSNWGYCWLRGGKDGEISSYVFRGSKSDGVAPGELKYSFPNTKLASDVWVHIAITFDYKTSTSFRSQLYVNGKLQKATWERGAGGSGTGTEKTYAKKEWYIDKNDWLSTAGLVYNGAAIDGTIDDFLVWNGVMTEEEIATAMKGYKAGEVPAKAIAYWDFENDPVKTSRGLGFKSESGKYIYNFECVGGEDAAEGQGVQTPLDPVDAAGCPFVGGSAYPVKTVPTWTARKMTVTEAEGTGAAGSAKVSFTKTGDYQLKLTLSNSYGTDEAYYPVFSVTDDSAINDVEANGALKCYNVGRAIFIELPDAGKYTVRVLDMQGRLLTQRATGADAGAMMQLSLGQSGVYLVEIVRDGKLARTFKVAAH